MSDRIMLEDYPAYLAAARGMGLTERVHRATTVPELFRPEELRELADQLAERGFTLWAGATGSSYCDRADAWHQLDVGVRLISRDVRFSQPKARAGRRYSVTIVRRPDEPETWELWCGYRRVARGVGRAALLGALDARACTRSRT